ncbi:hypothetical protein Vi05172_g12795 [Venturia inaequalis]|nr:hypothetical protein Vi05172_g12795 [Venturia inaequalis]
MSRTSDRPTPSSPADRFQPPLHRRDTTPISVDHEDRTRRRTAHLWNLYDDFGSGPSPDGRQEREDHCFEDFRPADPITRLNSSAQAAESGRTSSRTALTADTATIADDPRRAIGNMTWPREMVDAAENKYPDLDQHPSFGSQWQHCAAPTTPEQGSQNMSATGSLSYTSHAGSSAQKSFGEASSASVESYHAALQKLNVAEPNNGSGTRTSVKRWLKGQRRRPGVKLVELERDRLSASATWPASPAAAPHTPNHISTFQPADEYKALDCRSVTSQRRSQRVDKHDRRVSIIPEVTSSPSTRRASPIRKERRRSFFGSIGSALGSIPITSPKNQSKQQDKQLEEQQDDWERRLSGYSQHRTEEDPFGQASPLTYNPTKSSGRSGRTGYFSRRPRSSEGDVNTPVKGPYVGFSRRIQKLESPPLGGGRLTNPETPPSEQDSWLKPHRSRVNRSSSSAYSPCDTSARAMENPAAYIAWKTNLDSRADPNYHFNETPTNRRSLDDPLDFDRPTHASDLLHTPNPVLGPTLGHLPVEASRVTTPPTPTPNEPTLKKKQKKRKYFWDSFYPRGPDRDSTKASTKDSDQASVTSDRWHTQFPMPQDASITRAKNTAGSQDWYRIRMDQIMGEDDGDDEAKDIEDLRMFEWDLPEHLPSSPLCPLHPKNSSKGKGVCVYHGRKKRRDGTLTSGKYGETSPTELGVEKWI